MKKGYVLLAAAFFLIGSQVFAGGGRASGSSGSKTEVVMTSWYGGGSGRTLFGSMIEDFEKSHPNVKIVANYTTYNDYHGKINSMIAAGSPPDIMFLEEFLVNEWGEKGTVADIAPYYKEAGIDPQKFYVDGALFSTGGHVWGVTNPMETLILYYNKKLLKEAGITPPPESAANPWTWEQFVAAAKKLTKDSRGRTPNDSGFNYDNVVQYGTTNAGGYGGSWVYVLPFVYTAGSSVANANGTQIEITKPAGAKALQNLADLALKDKVAPTVALSSSNAAFSSLATMLMNDQLGMFINGNGTLVDFINEGYDVGIAQIPSVSGKGNNMVWGNGITLKPGASKEAFEFLVYMLDFNNRIKAATANKLPIDGIPQTRSVFDDPAKNKAWLDIFNPGMARLTGDILLNGSRLGEQMTLKNFGEIMDKTLVPSWDKIWLGEQTAEQVLGGLHNSLQGMVQGVWR